MKSTPKTIHLDNLILDKENPRFAELYSGSEKEEDVIDYLLYNESAEDIAKAISKANEFYPDRPLWVLKEGKNYIVKDGNRRCAAVKALQYPSKYGLGDIKKIKLEKLPVLVYHNESDLNERIRQEHTSNLFRQWGRIAKAIEIHRLFSSGTSLESMVEYDSTPRDLIKLASFYYEAVNISSEDFKKLLRSGKGKSGGKTIIFERLFRYKNRCGYSFKSKSTNEVIIKDGDLFTSYIKAMVAYLNDHPETTSRDIDTQQEAFLNKLSPYGFPPTQGDEDEDEDGGEQRDSKPREDNNPKNPASGQPSPPSQPPTPKRKSVKHRPSYTRKGIPSSLERLIKECYDLSQDNFANAKVALTRVTFECCLKYIIENTHQTNGKPLSNHNYFRLAFFDKKGNRRAYTDFDELKKCFTELIVNTGIKKAFENFDLQRQHQVIHNYRVGAVPSDAKAICDNLIDLLEFMLQEETDLVSGLDLSKI